MNKKKLCVLLLVNKLTVFVGFLLLLQAEIKPMVNAGIKGFKCFLIHSGVDEFPCVAENDVRLAMKQMQGTDAVFLVCSLASNKAGIWQGVWEMTVI